MRRLTGLLALSAALVVGVPADGHSASFTLTAYTGQGCHDASESTTNVQTLAVVSSSCVGGQGGFSINDLALAQGIFDADGLRLGVFAQSSQTAPFPMELVDVVGARVDFTDQIALIGGTIGEQGFLRTTFAIDGFFAATVPVVHETRFSVGGTSHQIAGPTVITVETPFVFGTTGVFSASFLTDIFYIARGGSSAFAIADFANTASLVSAAVLNSDRQVIAGQVVSASGLSYQPRTPVSEPGTLLLLASALGGLGLKRRPRH
jgi:hypothetical protein